MGYRREHIRIPVSGNAILSNRQNRGIRAEVVNICEGGIGITIPPPRLKQTEYHVNFKTKSGLCVQFMGALIHQNKHSTGLKTVAIDQKNLKTIHQLIADFQASEEFILYIDSKNILTDWFVDKNGRELEFNFESPN